MIPRQPDRAAHTADPEFALTANSKREPPSLHRSPPSESLCYETSHEAPSRAVGIRRALPAIGGPSVPRITSHFRRIGPTESRAGRGGGRARSPAARVSAVAILGRAGAGRGVVPPPRIVSALLSATVSSRSPESANAPIFGHFRA
jgi:hypothetical protein